MSKIKRVKKVKLDPKKIFENVEIVDGKSGKEKLTEEPGHAEEYNEILEDFGVSEKFTKLVTKPKFDKVRDNIAPLEDVNLQCDLLMLPETDDGDKYLFTIVDLWSTEIDCRPLKTKSAENVLKALKSVLKGDHINALKRLRSDGGSEFKGDFHGYLYDNGIIHSVALPYRHKQTGTIENVNRLISRFLVSYMSNNKTSNWTDIDLPKLMTELNKVRKQEDEDPYTYEYAVPLLKVPIYKVGDVVIRKLDHPIDEDNNLTNTANFRTGDLRYDKFQPRKIVSVFNYPNNVRYMLEGIKQASYTEDELLPAEEDASFFNVRKIWNKRRIGKETHYRVWYKGELKKQSQWIPKKQLIEDGFQDEIDEYENN